MVKAEADKYFLCVRYIKSKFTNHYLKFRLLSNIFDVLVIDNCDVLDLHDNIAKASLRTAFIYEIHFLFHISKNSLKINWWAITGG